MIDLKEKAQQIIARYPQGRQRSALIPLLRLTQERDGYLTKDGIEEIGHILGLTPAEVTAVATFYTMLYLKTKGRHVVSVCHNLACSLSGAEELISTLERELGVECGHTTADGEFTLERAECLAFCDKAPMLQIDYDEMVGPLTPDSAVTVIRGVGAAAGSRSDRGLISAAEGSRKARELVLDMSSPSHARSGPSAPPTARGREGTPASSLGEEKEKEKDGEEEPLLVESISLSEEEEEWLHREEGDE